MSIPRERAVLSPVFRYVKAVAVFRLTYRLLMTDGQNKRNTTLRGHMTVAPFTGVLVWTGYLLLEHSCFLTWQRTKNLFPQAHNRSRAGALDHTIVLIKTRVGKCVDVHERKMSSSEKHEIMTCNTLKANKSSCLFNFTTLPFCS